MCLWLAWRVGWDLPTARERVRVSRKLAELPLVDEELRRGAMRCPIRKPELFREWRRLTMKNSGLGTPSTCRRRSWIHCVVRIRMFKRMIKRTGRRLGRWLARWLLHKLQRSAR